MQLHLRSRASAPSAEALAPGGAWTALRQSKGPLRQRLSRAVGPRIDANSDGSVTYRFGEEEAQADTGLAVDEPLQAHASTSSNGSSNGYMGALSHAASTGGAGPHHVLLPAAAEHLGEPLQEALHLGASSNGNGSSTSSSNGNGSSRNGSAPSGSGRVGAASTSGSGALGAIAGDALQQPSDIPAGKEGKAAAKLDPLTADFSKAPASSLLGMYNACCRANDLDTALLVLKQSIRAGRGDVLKRLQHYRFLRPAASLKAVRAALRFVQLLPRQFADTRTYNMLLTVCAEAADLRAALRVADMARGVGIKPDTILYTNLIKVCAAVGDAEQAFLQYADMRAAGVPAEKQVFATLISACGEAIGRMGPGDRRKQLVLLERAFGAVEDMQRMRVPADAAVWNALVTAAGRAGQLQRAFNVLEEMLAHSARPNARTFAALIDACARAGDQELGMRVYRKALREGGGDSVRVYSAAITACVRSKAGADLATAMEIYREAQLNHVELDSVVFGSLMMAAGSAGSLDQAVALSYEMEREGIEACEGTDSALLVGYVHHGKLPEAMALYSRLRARGAWPHRHAMNALINAHASAFRLGDVVTLVAAMAEGGIAPDAFTFSAILNACQRSDESELAMDVFRAMRARGVKVDDVHALLLLRMCYNRLRQAWQAERGGPAAAGSTSIHGGPTRTAERERLLCALVPGGAVPAAVREGEGGWLAHSLAIWREVASAGVRPSMRVLSMALQCLRVPWNPRRGMAAPGGAVPVGAVFAGRVERSAPQAKIGIEGVYHVQALAIVEEAIVSGLLPSFTVDSEAGIDLRSMPPPVAEVYAMTVVAALQRAVDSRRVLRNPVALIVPPYDGSRVFMPSYLTYVDFGEGGKEAGRAPVLAAAKRSEPSSPSSDDDNEAGVSFADADRQFAAASKGAAGPMADTRTGLGVAGSLRRLRLWAKEYDDKGVIILEPKEVMRWAKLTQRLVEKRSLSALPVQKPYGQAQPVVQALMRQRRNIRMGM